MGRQAGTTSNWRLRLPKGRSVYICRITHNGRTSDHSTGESDIVAATAAGARIYADHIQRAPQQKVSVKRGAAPPLHLLLGEWLANDGTIDRDTADMWQCYARRYVEHFRVLGDITEATATLYRDQRLRQVQAVTVRKEMSTLRRFVAWAHLHRHLPKLPSIPGVPASATGTKHPQRRRVAAPELTPGEIAAFLAALPEWSSSRRVEAFPIRARFVFAYETGLRPGAIDTISVPEHWQPGSSTLRLESVADKTRWGRELPLTPRAVAALAAAAPEKGIVFGAHDYREHVSKAAKLVMPAHKSDVFTGAHLRSAITTHELEATGNLPGVQYLRGHKKATTTAGYAKASLRAAEAVHMQSRRPNATT